MYNKLFTRILDSSIWCEDYSTRIVWVMFLAAMDEDGIVHMATARNVAARANVTQAEAEAAIDRLQSPDPSSSNQTNEGRRIERFPGGWLVINAAHYREMATRLQARAKTAERVRKHRARDGNNEQAVTLSNASVTVGNSTVTVGNASVTTSEAYTEAPTSIARKKTARSGRDGFDSFWATYPKKVARQAALKAWTRIPASVDTADIMAGLARALRSEQWVKDGGQFVPHAATWLNGGRWSDDLPPAAAVSQPTTPAAGTGPKLDPCFGVPIPIEKYGIRFGRYYEYATMAMQQGDMPGEEWDAVHEQWMAYRERMIRR